MRLDPKERLARIQGNLEGILLVLQSPRLSVDRRTRLQKERDRQAKAANRVVVTLRGCSLRRNSCDLVGRH